MIPPSALPDLGVAVTPTATILLDVARDRYFALPADAGAVFVDLAAGRPRVSEDRQILAEALAPRELDAALRGIVPSNRHALPLRAYALPSVPRKRRATIGAVVDIALARLRLAILGLSPALRYVAACGRVTNTPASNIAASIIGAHRRADRWSSAHADCLTRAIALSAALWRAGIANDLVIGVKATPFGAHSWVQIGDCVVNDRPERVRPFTPILVL